MSDDPGKEKLEPTGGGGGGSGLSSEITKAAEAKGNTCVTKTPYGDKKGNDAASKLANEKDLAALYKGCLKAAESSKMFVIYPDDANEGSSNCWLCSSEDVRSSKMNKAFLFKVSKAPPTDATSMTTDAKAGGTTEGGGVGAADSKTKEADAVYPGSIGSELYPEHQWRLDPRLHSIVLAKGAGIALLRRVGSASLLGTEGTVSFEDASKPGYFMYFLGSKFGGRLRFGPCPSKACTKEKGTFTVKRSLSHTGGFVSYGPVTFSDLYIRVLNNMALSVSKFRADLPATKLREFSFQEIGHTSTIVIGSRDLPGYHFKFNRDETVGLSKGEASGLAVLSPGLTGKTNTVSFEDSGAAGWYVVAKGLELVRRKMTPDDATSMEQFKIDATFTRMPSTTGNAQFSGYYLEGRGYIRWGVEGEAGVYKLKLQALDSISAKERSSTDFENQGTSCLNKLPVLGGGGRRRTFPFCRAW
jgi:hypothetical protein